MSNRRQPGQQQRVDKEDGTQPDRHLDQDVAGVCAKHCLAHAAADCAAEATLLRLLEHHDKREQKAHNHFYHIQETYEE